MLRSTAYASSTSQLQCSYHVFLSFQWEATLYTFIDHLSTALLNAGLRTFRDEDEIERGKNVMSEMMKALKEARSSIIVFSQNYACSMMCLEKLLLILQRNKTSGHVILPVFYDVDPSQVRKQSGSFGEAFARYQKKIDMEIDPKKKDYLRNRVDRWRAALGEVADPARMILACESERYQWKFIQKIVEVIADKLNRKVLNVAPYLVGTESRAQNIISCLQDESAGASAVLICGMGGIGKTTVAKLVYNLNFENFEGSSFLSNIREISEQPNGLINLQKQLLSDILKREIEDINSVNEGTRKILSAISGMRVLVVLDDVDKQDQVQALIGLCRFFHRGSKIIITTRHRNLFIDTEVYLHEVERLSDDESSELFSWHAFEQNHPVEYYFNHSKKVLEHCEGLPLALQVLGSSLSGKSLNEWNRALHSLATITNSEISKKLKISYDCLPNDGQKELFLLIACSFLGETIHFVDRILKGCNFYPSRGLQSLIDRCLLKINEDGRLVMHQLLREMAREIVHQECPDNLGERSILWHHQDSYRVLRDQIGTRKIKGLFLDMRVLKEDNCSNRSYGVSNAKRPRLEEVTGQSSHVDQGNSLKRRRFSFLSWYPVNTTTTNSDQVELETDAFTTMQELMLLKLNYVKLKGGYKDFPKTLRWLSWHGFSLTSIPSDFPLEGLVALDLRNSNLKQVWKETTMLNFLKILNLSHSHALASSPDFSYSPNLEELILNDCRNLVVLHKSIGKLKGLLLLDLRGCKKLRQLPSEIVHLNILEKLILSDCSGLNELPTGLCKMKALTVLHADGINGLCLTSGEVKSWLELFWSWMSKSQSIPQPICFSLNSLPHSLISLNLANCNLDSISLNLANCNLDSDAIGGNLGPFPQLQDLDLSGNPICSLPGWLKGLPCLHTLKLNDCIRLKSLPELPTSLRYMSVAYCRSLQLITNLPNLFTDLILDATNCSKLVEVQGLLKLKPAGNTDSEMINKLDLAKLDANRMLEVNLFNFLAGASKKSPVPQELYECGIHSIFIPGGELPVWFEKKSRGGSAISFTIPPRPTLKIRGLNVCVVFALASASGISGCAYECISLNNKTRDLNWTYSPIVRATRDGDRDLMWLSDWKIANRLMEAGDEVIMSVKMTPYLCHVKEFGIQILYGGECPQDVTIDFSEYDMSTGNFLLFNSCRRDRDLLYSKIRGSCDPPATAGMFERVREFRMIIGAEE